MRNSEAFSEPDGIWNPVRLFLEISLFIKVEKTGEADYSSTDRQANMFLQKKNSSFCHSDQSDVRSEAGESQITLSQNSKDIISPTASLLFQRKSLR